MVQDPTGGAMTAAQPMLVHNPLCATEPCRMCQEVGLDQPATHEASAYLAWVDPIAVHTWLCCTHFGAVFGQDARDLCAKDPA